MCTCVWEVWSFQAATRFCLERLRRSRSWYFAFVLLHFCKEGRTPKCPKQACAIWNFEKYPAPEFPGLPSYKPRSAASSKRDECWRLGSPGRVSALRTVSKTSQSLGLAWALLQRPCICQPVSRFTAMIPFVVAILLRLPSFQGLMNVLCGEAGFVKTDWRARAHGCVVCVCVCV